VDHLWNPCFAVVETEFDREESQMLNVVLMETLIVVSDVSVDDDAIRASVRKDVKDKLGGLVDPNVTIVASEEIRLDTEDGQKLGRPRNADKRIRRVVHVTGTAMAAPMFYTNLRELVQEIDTP